MKDLEKTYKRYDCNKDYLTREQAAHYCCISLAKFESIRCMYGIEQLRFGGKVMYRRADLQDVLEGSNGQDI